MHKLTDATMEIIEVMASNAYNGVGDKDFSGNPLEFIKWKLIHLILLLNKRWICWPKDGDYDESSSVDDDTHSPTSCLRGVYEDITCGKRLPIHPNLEGSELFLVGKVLVMIPTLIPITKGGEITHTSF